MASSGRTIVATVLIAFGFTVISFLAGGRGQASRAAPPVQQPTAATRDVRPSTGVLAPYRAGWLGTRREIARIPRSSLGATPVLEVDALADTAVVLQPQHWWLATRGHLRGPFGTRPDSARLLSARTLSVAHDGSGVVVVLDNQRGRVFFWDSGGQRLVKTLDLTSRLRVRLREVSELTFDGQQRVVATAHGIGDANQVGAWLLLRYDSASVDTLLRSTSMDAVGRAFATLSASTLADGSIVAVTAGDYATWWIAPNGRLDRHQLRVHAPRWRVSALARARIATLLAGTPKEMRSSAAYEQPEYYPAVQQIAALDNACVVVATVAGFSNAVYFEVLDRSGQAVGRLAEAPMSGHWKLTPAGIVWRRDDGDDMVIELQPFHAPGCRASH